MEALAEKILTGVEKQKGTLAALWKKTNERFPDLKPDQRTQALVFMELADSYGALKKLRDLDLKYAVSTAEEALALETCRPTVSALMGELEKTPSKVKRRELLRQKAIGSKEPEQAACRRTPTALVDWSGARCKTADAGAGCKTVAQWHESLIVERLALATAVTADVLVRAWKDGGMVSPCWSWQYAMKPGFVSPTDGSCFGYARSERAEDVLTSTKPMPSIWKTNSKTAIDCARF